MPAAKQPMTFTNKVGIGNLDNGPSHTDTPNRKDAPIAPPAATLITGKKDVIGIELAFLFRGLYRKNGITMNRLIICTILLAFGQAAFAEELYRWTEDDGSITFSPMPPPDGVDYKLVQSGNTSEVSSNEVVTAKPSILATSEHDIRTPSARVNAAPQSTQPLTAAAKPALTYAPELNSGITRSAPDTNTVVAANTAEPKIQTIGSNKKRQQCEDLSKRVTSLERRLRADLNWEDMDNTVIAMARYQRSFDQHCAS